MSMPASDLYDWFLGLELDEHDTAIAKRILLETDQRLKTLLDVGLGSAFISLPTYL
jgi:excinuclease ABC subunit A